MRIFTKLISGLLVMISYSSIVFANSLEKVKTLIFNSIALEKIRKTDPNFLNGLALDSNQILKIEQNENEEILNIRVFDVETLGASRLDERS